MSADEKSVADAVPISFFRGRYEFLSNFHRCDVAISPSTLMLGDDLLVGPSQGIEVYPTSEHAFQAGKTFDANERRRVREADIPSRAKGMGRRVKLRPDWEQVKEEVMLVVLRAKFSDDGLARLLLDTGERPLVEGNTWGDSEWGCVQRGGAWVGENKLGKALEIVRAELRR